MTQTFAQVAPMPELMPAQAPPPLDVTIEAAHDMAMAEQRGYDTLAELGVADLGSTYLTYNGQEGEVVATLREAVTVCSHLGDMLRKLPPATLGVVIQSMSVEPPAAGSRPNLPSPNA